MTYGYNLRPKAKGRQRHQSTSSTSELESGHEILPDEEQEGESGTVDPRPATPDTPRAAQNSNSPAAPTRDPKHNQTTERENWQQQQQRHLRETQEEIQAARKREEARSCAEAVRIRHEQVVRGYEAELRALRARIFALRREGEVAVENARRKWERAWAVERGEVAVVVEEEDVGNGREEEGLSSFVGSEDCWKNADGAMEMTVDRGYCATTEIISSSLLGGSCSSENNFMLASAPAPALLRKNQQQPHWGMVGPSQHNDNDDGRGPGPAGETQTGSADRQRMRFPTLNHLPSQGRKSHSGQSHHPQPLRRQPAQLMVIPTTSSHRLDT
jgi:hypothetical protein